MKRNESIFFFAVIAFFLLFSGGCGQPIPPTGGPKDTLPPLITGSVPADSSLNFSGNKITLQFNEYITLENPFEQISYSPLPKINPQAEGRLKTVTIKIKDTLEPNTTYSIDFGESIKDINEDNILRDYRFVFSTGPRIDSGVLTGRVLLAESGKPDSTLIVVLHRNADDSAVAKEKPRYATRLKGNGDFTFRYLAPGQYYIFALKDVDGAKKYDQKSERIGFLDKPVTVNQSEPIILYAFEEVQEEPEAIAATTVKAPVPPRNKEDKRLKFTNNLEGGKQDILSNLEFNFENKLAAYDSAKLIFGDEKYVPVKNYRLMQDSTAKKIILSHAWIPDNKYTLIIQKDFAKDSLGNSITRTDTLGFQAKKESDYGSLDIKLANLDTNRHPILQLYQDEKIEFTQPLLLNRYKIRLFRPGEYEVRILFDSNQNGKWDTGNYWKKLQPEKIITRKQKLTIRANWDNELEINLLDFEN